jgi:hypothetical protein
MTEQEKQRQKEEANPYKRILTDLLLQLEFGGLVPSNIPQFLAEEFKKHSVIVGVNEESKSLGLMVGNVTVNNSDKQ